MTTLTARPSGAAVWLACPLGLTMQNLYGDRYPSGAAAEEGTAAHWVLEAVSPSSAVPCPAVGDTAPNGVAVTPEMIGHASEAVAYASGLSEGGQMLVEHRLTLKLPNTPDVHGTADVVVLPPDGRTVHVVDYKYGFTHVPADAPQLKIYGLAAAQEFNRRVVHLHVIQPRDYTAKPVRSHHFTPAEQNDFAAEVTQALKLAHLAKPYAAPGCHCQRCPGRGHCAALRNASLDLSTACGTDTAAPEAVAAELHIAQQAVDLATARLKGLQDEAQHVLSTGGLVPGWSLERKPGREQWTDEQPVLALADGFGLLDTVSQRRLITPNQAIKAGLPAELVRMHTTRPMGEAKLVPTGETLAARVFTN